MKNKTQAHEIIFFLTLPLLVTLSIKSNASSSGATDSDTNIKITDPTDPDPETLKFPDIWICLTPSSISCIKTLTQPKIKERSLDIFL